MNCWPFALHLFALQNITKELERLIRMTQSLID
jgi:hypothetical protein